MTPFNEFPTEPPRPDLEPVYHRGLVRKPLTHTHTSTVPACVFFVLLLVFNSFLKI